MAHKMQTFEHSVCERNVSLNTVMVDGEPWFRGNDVAHALDHGNPRQAISTHVEEGDRAYLKDLGRPSDGRPLKHNDGLQIFISESGLYSLILGSQKAEAKVFQRWITNEVLPNIRKTRQYTLNTVADMSKKRAELEIAENRHTHSELQKAVSRRTTTLH